MVISKLGGTIVVWNHVALNRIHAHNCQFQDLPIIVVGMIF